MSTIRTRRSRRIAGIGLMSLAVQLLASQALAFADASAPSPSPTPSASPTAVATTTPSPVPEPSEEPLPKPVEEGRAREVVTNGAQAGFSATADPAAIRIGESSTLTAEVTNTGDAELKNAMATFTLPYQLALGSRLDEGADPVTSAGTRSVTFDDIDVPPGGSESVVVAVVGEHGTGGRPAQVLAELATSESILTSRIEITVSGPGLKLRTFSDQESAEVGEVLDYNVKVSATGDEPLTDVTITDHIPDELKFVWVELLDGITYRRLGGDIIWTVDSITSGETLHLRWRGEVAETGRDYLARNVVDASAASLPLVTAETTTGLLISPGTVPVDRGAGDGKDPASAPGGPGGVPGTGGPDLQGAVAPAGGPGDGGPLPFTGSDPRSTLLTAFALMAAGTLLLWGGRDRLVGGIAPGSEEPLVPWVALLPQGRGLYELVQELRREALA